MLRGGTKRRVQTIHGSLNILEWGFELSFFHLLPLVHNDRRGCVEGAGSPVTHETWKVAIVALWRRTDTEKLISIIAPTEVSVKEGIESVTRERKKGEYESKSKCERTRDLEVWVWERVRENKSNRIWVCVAEVSEKKACANECVRVRESEWKVSVKERVSARVRVI